MKKNNKKGFTLVELVIVVAVMAVLIAVAIPTVTSITETARQTVADTNARTIEATLKLAEANKSKDGDTVLELTGAEIKAAVESAKLGIESGVFEYVSTAGTVVAKHDMTSAPNSNIPTGTFYIVFTNSVVSVSPAA